MASGKSLRVAVVGGGISGLSAAFHLQRGLPKGSTLKLIEASDRVGGWIHSKRKGEFLFECGPATLRGAPAGEDTWDIVKSIGLDKDVLAPTKMAKNRYLYAEGSLQKLDPLQLLRECPQILLEPFKERGPADETVASMLTRRFGKRFTEKYGDAMVNGIYAGGIDQLSAAAASPFSRMKAMEQEFGSITKAVLHKLAALIRARWGVGSSSINDNRGDQKENLENDAPPAYTYTFRHGMGSLPTRLADYLSDPSSSSSSSVSSPPFNSGGIASDLTPVEICLEAPLKSIKFHRHNIGNVDCGTPSASLGDADGAADPAAPTVTLTIGGAGSEDRSSTETFDAVVVAIPAQKLSQALNAESQGYAHTQDVSGGKDFSCSKDLLRTINKTGSCVVISVGFNASKEEQDHQMLPEGFGHLIPRKEGESALGIIWHSSVFKGYGDASDSQRRYTVMIGGDQIEEAFNYSESKLEALAREAVYKHLGVLPPHDAVFNISYAKESIAHYQVGHIKNVCDIREDLPPSLQVAGASFDGVSVHDCITSGKNAADSLLQNLKT